METRLTERASPDVLRFTLILAIALCQGLLYLVIVPPWQHYDEPTHYEYARLLADLGHLPRSGDEIQSLRREIAGSMLQYGFYAPPLAKPMLLTDDGQIWLGISELQHPPLYYLVASLPLGLVSALDVVTQLYVLRAVSLGLYLITIGIAYGIVRDLTEPGNWLRWLTPLTIVLLPVFADSMTSVNNDAGAVVVFSALLWVAVRVIQFGITWQRVVALAGLALFGVATKTTAAIGLLIAPMAILVSYWLRSGRRWRVLLLPLLAVAAVLLLATVTWGDAAYWYRGVSYPVQQLPTRVESAVAPLGAHALQLEATADVGARRLINPLPNDAIRDLAGQRVTLGGWVWASRPTSLARLGLMTASSDETTTTELTAPLKLTTNPTFVAHSFTIPRDASSGNFLFVTNPPDAGEEPVQVFLDGAVVAAGVLPNEQAPVFDAGAATGTWDGVRFTNLVRAASAEQAWPRLRPWIDQLMTRYTRRAMSQIPVALLDVGRIWPVLLSSGLLITFDGLIDRFAWGQVQIPFGLAQSIARALALVAFGGAVWWFARRRSPVRPAVGFLALATLLVWINTMLRPLPLIDSTFVAPITRYAFPAIIPIALAFVGGLFVIWPRYRRIYPIAIWLILLLVLNVISAQTIRAFYS